MRYKRLGSMDEAAIFLAGRINSHLEDGKSVAWFVSGGSAIALAVAAGKLIKDAGRLSITLADERYGPNGHKDSNWWQLAEAGFLVDNADMVPVLTGNNMVQTANEYEAVIERLNKSDYKIALLGFGDDGHTAGILPNSPAVSMARLSAHYNGPDYARITITPAEIEKLDEVIVYAIGENKRAVLDRLKKDISIEEMPAQIIKKVPVVTVYNDYIEEDI